MKKRILPCLIVAAFLLASAVMPSFAAGNAGRGDLNGDGQITSIDYFLLKRFLLKTGTLPEDALSRADVSADGTVNASDYLLLKRIILGTAVLPAEKASPVDRSISFTVNVQDGAKTVTIDSTLRLHGDANTGCTLSYHGEVRTGALVWYTIEKEWEIPALDTAEIDSLLRSYAQQIEEQLSDLIGQLPL